MLIRFFLLIGMATFVSCLSKPNFQIDGELESTKFDGELVFLLPFQGYTQDKVDSTTVENGKFSFTKKVDKPEICIIRTKALLRLQLQELLIVREPGRLNVNLALSSSAYGTALNDSLQKWKNIKTIYDNELNENTKLLGLVDSTHRSRMQAKVDSIIEARRAFNFNFVRNNKSNIVGEFVNRMMGPTFTAEQKAALLEK